MPRIRWVEEEEATGEVAEIYDRARAEFPGGMVPDIVKTMSLRPDFLRGIRLADAFDIHPPPILDADGVPRAVTEGP